MSLVMAACAGAWRYLLFRMGVLNPFVVLFSTVLVGALVYIWLVLWRRPPAVTDLATVLEGSSFRATRWIARRLPRSPGTHRQINAYDSVPSAKR